MEWSSLEVRNKFIYLGPIILDLIPFLFQYKSIMMEQDSKLQQRAVVDCKMRQQLLKLPVGMQF